MIDFAFFVANFGYSKRDYNELTEVDKAFIRKAYENKVVTESTLIRDAVLNAIANYHRKRGKSFMKLWKKKPKKTDRIKVADDLKLVTEIEAKETGWIDKIYAANGWKKPKRKKVE